MKRKVKDPSACLKFKDMVEMVTLKAGMLKAKGEYVFSKQQTVEKLSAKVAAAATTRNQYRSGDQARTNSRPERISDSRCSFCSKDHQSELCPKWLDTDLNARVQEVKRLRLCFKCLEGQHISWNCPMAPPRCGQCGDTHLTILHQGRSEANREQQRSSGQQPSRQVSGTQGILSSTGQCEWESISSES